MKQIESSNPLGTEKIGKLMLKYSIPGIISLVVNNLYNMADQVYIGQGVGYLGNVLSLARQIFFLIPLILILGKNFGIDGVLWAGAFSDALAAILAAAVAHIFWKSLFMENK